MSGLSSFKNTHFLIAGLKKNDIKFFTFTKNTSVVVNHMCLSWMFLCQSNTEAGYDWLYSCFPLAEQMPKLFHSEISPKLYLTKLFKKLAHLAF